MGALWTCSGRFHPNEMRTDPRLAPMVWLKEGKVIWILLATLGVPVWLIVGALGGALWSRRTFRRAPGVFPCKTRLISGSEDSGNWPRATAYARWLHDVLLVHAGLALVRVRALPVAGVDAQITSAPDVKLKGDHPVSIRLELDDGSVVEVAASKDASQTLAGPFLALAASPEEGATG
jgi:hypothetical protein